MNIIPQSVPLKSNKIVYFQNVTFSIMYMQILILEGVYSMKRIALINDLSGFGKCSLTAAIPVISCLGVQACPLPTAILTAQTGFSSFYCDDYTDKMNYFIDEWKKMNISFDGIHSGYLGSAAQIRNVLCFLEQFNHKNTLYLADPVMGDNGHCYSIYTDELRNGMKELTKRANIITPNLTELCLLANKDYDQLITYSTSKNEDFLKYIEEISHQLLENADANQTILVTGIVRYDSSQAYMGNLAVSSTETYYHETSFTGKSFSGTGDLFASVIAGSLVQGSSIQEAIRKAAAFLQPAIEEASLENVDHNHGVHFEKYLHLLTAQ